MTQSLLESYLVISRQMLEMDLDKELTAFEKLVKKRQDIVDKLQNDPEQDQRDNDKKEVVQIVSLIAEVEEELKKKIEGQMKDASENIQLAKAQKLDHGQMKLKLKRMSNSMYENKGYYFDKRK